MTTALDDPKPSPTVAYEDGEFLDFGYVPVFKEHTDREGNEFDAAAMERIAARCNERIEDTGDFAPLVINHTDDGGETDPQVVGFVGPYRLGKVGAKNPRVAIFGRLRVFKRDADRVRRYPRLSVELWSKKDDPTNGFFDPISLLGATTPELDLGIRFSKHGEDFELRRYSRVTRFEATPSSPGGSNTYIPGGESDEGKDRKKNYDSGGQGGGMLSDADIQQLITALKPVVEEAVDARMAAMKTADPMAAGGMGGTGGEDAGAEQFAAGAADEGEGLPGDAEMAGDEDMDIDDADGDGDEDDESDAGDRDEFSADDDDFDGLDDDEDADDSRDDVDPGVSDSGSDDESPDKKSKYSADANVGRDFFVIDPDKEPAMADKNAADAITAEQVKRYQKERDDAKADLAKVTKERDEIRAKYQKEVEVRRGSETELNALKERVEKIEASERRAVRYQKLAEIASKGYTFDVEEEIEDVKDVSQEAFDKHCERILSKYQRVPTDMLPVAASDRLDHARRVKGDGEAERRERFSKIAQDNCVRDGKHKPGDFKAEFERLLAEDDAKQGGKSAA